MNTQDFSTTLLVDQSPREVFDAISNVRGWWSEEIEGDTNHLNAEFDYHFQDLHRSRMRITEFLPGEKVTWLVLDNYFKFTTDKSEWTGTRITFEIFPQNGQTAMRFTHVGLTPHYECYEVCKNAWTTYIQKSLRQLISTGEGEPNSRETPRTEAERQMGTF